ncbi:MAG: ABC transporter permease [Dehalococcoidia bacterium]
MDSLFGIPLTSILAVLVVLVAGIFGLLGWIGWRNPLLVKMGLRNLTRRKTQTVLIVIGLMLSTLIISAAFATGDTVGYSITNTIYNDFGEADVIVVFDRDAAEAGQDNLQQADVDALRAALADDADVDGITGFVRASAPALNPDERLSEPAAAFVGAEPSSTDDFNALITPDGESVLAADLGPSEVYVSESLAEDVHLEAGDAVRVFWQNEPHDFTVRAIVRDNALTAATAITSGRSAGGIVAPLDRVWEITGEPGRLDMVVVSATGGVRDTLDITADLRDRVEGVIEAQDLPMQVATDKAEAVGFAELAGSVFVSFFLVFGLFSMAAGVMLIFLTFVMLAAERRSEMGMARAVGMKRLHLTESFIAEGMGYNIGSALVGALLGVGVAYLLILVLGNVFSDFGVSITFNANPIGFAISYLVGVVITFVTVAISSWRSANLNIVRAIRDIPEPDTFRGRSRSAGALIRASLGAAWLVLAWAVVAMTFGAAFVVWFVLKRLPVVGRFFRRPGDWARRQRNSGGWAVVMILIGVFATWWGGWVAEQAFAYTVGTTLVLFAIAMLASYFGAPARASFAAISTVIIWYWLLPMPFNLLANLGLLPDEAKGWSDPLDGVLSLVGLDHEPIVGNIEMFFVSGVCITAASTLFVIFNADRLLSSLGALQALFRGLTPAIRTAISYPLASKLRTGMALAMFTLVMFSLVVMATLNHNFTQLFLGEDAKGGFDVQATANENNPIDDLRAALAEGGYDATEIAGIGEMRSVFWETKEATGPEEDLAFYRFAGLDDDFLDLAEFPLSTRAVGYESDEAVWEAIRTDPGAIVANESILSFTQSQNFGAGGDGQLTVEGSITDLQDHPWEPIEMTVVDDEGTERTMRIIGFVDSAIIGGVVPQWVALFVGSDVVASVPDAMQDFFLTTSDESDDAVSDVAAAVESTLLERGVQADSLAERVNEVAATSNAFSTLFVAFMSLGLIVGIAALGVIAFRTVAERRQQIGMLRAIGYSRRLVAISFFLESSFIAVAGIGMGLVLGGALSYNLMTAPDFTNGQQVDFSFPVTTIVVIVAVAYVASALMTLIPARSASRVAVAEALRYSA